MYASDWPNLAKKKENLIFPKLTEKQHSMFNCRPEKKGPNIDFLASHLAQIVDGSCRGYFNLS